MDTLPDLALSVRQPWAWAIIHGGKDVENRGRRAINMGGMKPGRIAIHASKGMTREEYEGARRTMEKIGVDCPRPDQLMRGGVIGSVTVTDIVSESESPWFFGPWALTLQDPEPVPLPDVLYCCPGQLGFFKWKAGVRDGEHALGEAPLQWMREWPGQPKPGRKASPASERPPAPLPLFGEGS